MKNPKSIEQESNVDFYKGIFKSLIKNWYFFVISLFVTLSIGHYIFKSSPPIYRNNLVMLISAESGNRSQNAGELMQFEMFDIQSTIDDELGIIQSFPLINKTIQRLDLGVSYYMGEGLIMRDIYKNNPFVITFDSLISHPVNILFSLNVLANNKFRVSVKSDEEVYLYNLANNEMTGVLNHVDFSEEFSFGDEVVINDSRFRVLLNGNFTSDGLLDKKFYFRFNNIEQLTYQYQGELSIERTSNQSSMVNLEIKTSNSKLATDFLNTLADVYLGENLKKKNLIAIKTIRFINEQITEVADSLFVTARNLEDFRKNYSVMDINFLSQNVYNKMTQLEDQRAELVVKSKYYDYIKEYFENNKDLSDMLAPSAMGVDDPQLVSLINQLTDLNAQRLLHLENKSFKNPAIPDMNAKINNLKNTILENINYIVRTSIITLNDIDDRIVQLNLQISRLPTTEKELINIERKFNINNEIYTFLLRKRSEAEIARASNSPDYEIVDPAKQSSVRQVAPKKQMIYFSSFFLGLMIPIGLVFLLSAMNETVTDKRDIGKLTDFPVLASIAKNDKRSMIPVADFPKSLISESFRSLRTSLQFFHKNQAKQKLLVTSSFSGDGKTFLSINLAIAYSFFGKRTLLLDFDLRDPKVSKYLNLQNSVGLSSYLVNDARLEDIIQNTNIKNLDIITTGELPPNPVELVAAENTRNLMDILQSIYDYIIIDSPPIGVVTDAYLLMSYSDINIFTVRLNHTNKKLFTSLIDDIEKKEIPNFGIVINDDEEQMQSTYYDSEGHSKSGLMRRLGVVWDLMGKGKFKFWKKDNINEPKV